MNRDLTTVSRLYEVTAVGVACIASACDVARLIRESKCIGIEVVGYNPSRSFNAHQTADVRCDFRLGLKGMVS